MESIRVFVNLYRRFVVYQALVGSLVWSCQFLVFGESLGGISGVEGGQSQGGEVKWERV